jgi:hypothetical protein
MMSWLEAWKRVEQATRHTVPEPRVARPYQQAI